MGYSTRSYALRYSSSGGLPPGIKWLLISNIAIFVLYYFSNRAGITEPFRLLALFPVSVVERGFIWQLATYLFLHGGLGHILWNMLALWMFGTDLERTWGTRRFMRFYMFTGVGAGICVVIGNYVFSGGDPRVATIGCSGAIYGILLAYAILFPDRQILFAFLIPMKVKYFVMIIGAIAFLQASDSGTGVSHVAHLGGLVFAYIYMKSPRVRGVDAFASLRDQYRSWRVARAKRKFQVYLRKHGSNQGPFMN